MMPNITKLDWDSSFFGYDVGKCDVSDIDLTDFETQGYRLIYLFSKDELPIFAQNLMDRKVVYQFDIETAEQYFISESIEILEFDNERFSYKDLLNITYESGIYSRFFLDKNFQNGEFERLYKRWLDNSLTSDSNYKVYIAVSEGELMGFITIGSIRDDLEDIGLLAVNEMFRGRKIATSLLTFAKRLAQEKGAKNIQVVTQKQNLPACSLYEKAGFYSTDLTYIYHIWNHDTI